MNLEEIMCCVCVCVRVCVFTEFLLIWMSNPPSPRTNVWRHILMCQFIHCGNLRCSGEERKYHRGKGTTTMCYYIRVSILLSLSLRHPTIFNRHMYQTGQIFGTLTEYRLKITSHTSTNLKKKSLLRQAIVKSLQDTREGRPYNIRVIIPSRLINPCNKSNNLDMR